jgi:uncharacterized damage-inducible protein DinB
MSTPPEVWLRGPLAGYPPLLLPVAHALLQAREDVGHLAASTAPGHAWTRPGGAASIGFHLLHIAGSIDRLTTYARGAQLDAAQLRVLKAEATAEADAAREKTTIQQAADAAVAAIDAALAQVRATPEAALLEPREVGRRRLPSTVIGLLVHVAEHTTRHVGQAMTTGRILRGSGE